MSRTRKGRPLAAWRSGPAAADRAGQRAAGEAGHDRHQGALRLERPAATVEIGPAQPVDETEGREDHDRRVPQERRGDRSDDRDPTSAASNQPLAEVAADCGFFDQAHMGRLVKRVTGRTPAEIRRSR